MFDFDAGKLLIVGVIALIFIPPKDLPRFLREAGQFVGKMRRMAADFQRQFMDAMHEADVADLRREAQKLADAARFDPGFDNKIEHLKADMSTALETPPRSPDPLTAAAPHESVAADALPTHTQVGRSIGEAERVPAGDTRAPVDAPMSHSA